MTIQSVENSKAYLIGGGIAGLSSAAYLIEEGFDPKNIYILESLKLSGGSMDAYGNPETGYLMRGGRMFEEQAYTCLYDLLSRIPSPVNKYQSVKDDIKTFSKQFPTHSQARLVTKDHEKVQTVHLGLSVKDDAQMAALIVIPEHQIQGVKINEYFAPEFFHTNFWNIFCTTFAFQPWHSLIEMKRYMKRFLHCVAQFHDLSMVWRTIYNQYDSIIVPLETHLKGLGVNFVFETVVEGLEFVVREDYRAVDTIKLAKHSDFFQADTIAVAENDLVFTTLGSLTAASSVGSTDTPAKVNFDYEDDPTWKLWLNIAKKQPDFGNPLAFCSQPAKSAFLSFSCTFKNGVFLKRIAEWSKNQPGTGALVTLRDSPWFMSIVIPHQPHFANQPDDVQVCWGYGLVLDKAGSYIKKPMTECTGAEILQEFMYQIGFTDIMETALEGTIVLPAMLPYTMAQFMPRKNGDRPAVVPAKAKNFAFLGQFVEVPDDVVFTVEYSVRCAQTAVFKLLGSKRTVSPLYTAWLVPSNIANSVKAVLQ